MGLKSEMMYLVEHTEAKEAFCDFAEIALDSTLDDGVLKEIPVVGSLFKLGGAVLAIRERFLIKKIAAFLQSLDRVSLAERAHFLAELGDEEKRQKTGEKILFLLDRQDDEEKAKWIGILFVEYMLKNLTRHDFDALSHCVSIAFWPDVEGLELALVNPTFFDGTLGQILMSYGLVEMEVEIVSIEPGDFKDRLRTEARNVFRLSGYGELLAKIFAREKAGEFR